MYRNFKNKLDALSCMNVVLYIPNRHDLTKESIFNKEIRKAILDINTSKM